MRMTEAEYEAALDEIHALGGAQPGTPEWERLDRLVKQVQAFEARRNTLRAAYAKAGQDPAIVGDTGNGPSAAEDVPMAEEALARPICPMAPERDELGYLLGRAVAEEIRRARDVGANVVVNFEGYPLVVPATEVRLEGEGPERSIWEWCRREVEAHPLPGELMEELRRILPRELTRVVWLCSVSGDLGGARPLDRGTEDPAAVSEAARQVRREVETGEGLIRSRSAEDLFRDLEI